MDFSAIQQLPIRSYSLEVIFKLMTIQFSFFPLLVCSIWPGSDA